VPGATDTTAGSAGTTAVGGFPTTTVAAATTMPPLPPVGVTPAEVFARPSPVGPSCGPEETEVRFTHSTPLQSAELRWEYGGGTEVRPMQIVSNVAIGTAGPFSADLLPADGTPVTLQVSAVDASGAPVTAEAVVVVRVCPAS
jgi:hypothetical protein